MPKLYLFLISLVVHAASAGATDPIRLPALAADKSAITVSGLSSGAFMAVQLGTAYSQTFSGVGSLAGGIFWCAQGDLNRAQEVCMAAPENISVTEQVVEVRRLAKRKEIDDPANLSRQKIFILHGSRDTRVYPVSSDKLMEFYRHWIPASQIAMENRLPAAHGLPTLDYGNPCDMQSPPWILNCGYDAAGETLKALYGPLRPRQTADDSRLLLYSQEEFGGTDSVLYPSAWIYLPKNCTEPQAHCRLHVALHGCKMNPDFIGDEFVRHAGYNEWAESNDIVVLYPQAAKRMLTNAYGCWDWFGYTGADYAARSGKQMAAVKAMIDRVSGVQARSRN